MTGTREVTLHLTDDQFVVLRGVVAGAAFTEYQRVRRMKGRPRGSHTAATIAGAERLAQAFAHIESELERDQP